MTKRKKKRTDPAEAAFEELVERAKKVAVSGSAPRAHHLVPATYLRRWAEGDNEGVRVTDLEAGTTYVGAADKVARERDYYRIEHEDVDPEEVPELLAEVALGEVEAVASQAIRELVACPSQVDVELMARFAFFLALQLNRGRAGREGQRETAHLMGQVMHGNPTEEQIRARLVERGLEPTRDNVRAAREASQMIQDGTIVLEVPKASLIVTALSTAGEIGRHFLDKVWVVYRTPATLITSDEPVVPIGGPGWPRAQRAGIGTAGVVAFPLAPDRLLALVHPSLAHSHPPQPPEGVAVGDLDPVETTAVCREIAAHAHRWLFERPSKKVGSRLHVPALPPAAEMEQVPLVGDANEQLFRSYRMNRWASALEAPPWPVDRWWEAVPPRQFWRPPEPW